MNHFSIIIIPIFFCTVLHLFVSKPRHNNSCFEIQGMGSDHTTKAKTLLLNNILPPFVFVCKFRLFAWLWPSHDFSIASGGHDVYILYWYDMRAWFGSSQFFFQSLCHKLSSSVISVWSRRRRDGFTVRSKIRKKIREIKFCIIFFSSKKRLRWFKFFQMGNKWRIILLSI